MLEECIVCVNYEMKNTELEERLKGNCIELDVLHVEWKGIIIYSVGIGF